MTECRLRNQNHLHFQWCQGGECVPTQELSTTSEVPPSGATEAGWGPWKEGNCQSGCTARGKGFRERRRVCAAEADCQGSAYDVMLCDDKKVTINIGI